MIESILGLGKIVEYTTHLRCSQYLTIKFEFVVYNPNDEVLTIIYEELKARAIDFTYSIRGISGGLPEAAYSIEVYWSAALKNKIEEFYNEV